MTKNRVILVLLGICAAALLLMLMRPMPVDSAERLLAVSLLVASIVLVLLQLRAGQGALKKLAGTRSDELEARVGDLQRRLTEAEAFNQSVLDGVPDPAIIIDKDFGVTSINRAARCALVSNGGSSEPLPCYRALHGRDTPCDPAEHPCVLSTGESCKHIQTRTGEDGETRLVELRATPLYDEDGRITGAVEVLHDLNEQERLALKLQRAREDAATAHRARAEFVATMSHEVRTPLNAVLGMTDLLRLTSLTRKQKSYVQIMESSSNMLLSLVDNMIDFATLESGQLEIAQDSFHVTDLLERVLEIMGYQAYAKGIELAGVADFAPDTQVVGDLQRLRQIMINLVSNAIKFTDEGEVIVTTAVDTGADGQTQLAVSVTDSGIGMSEDAAGRLFTPFNPIPENGDSRLRGSGLGLAISKQLLNVMGGEISVDTELGRGTTVRFTVPVRELAGGARPVAEGRRTLSNRRLLVVNPNAKVAASIGSFLAAWDISVDFEDAPENIERQLSIAEKSGYPFECIVLDADDREDDRLALAKRIREASDIPIILLTSIAQPLRVGQVSSIGRLRCVNKPVLPSVMRYNLSRLFELDLGATAPSDNESLAALTILVAEDNPINRKLLGGMLKSLEFDVDTVNDGPAVLDALQETTYDLILMDCQMPGMDGDEVTRVIREGRHGRGGQPVIVAVTADVSADHKESCMRAGMDDFLAKPVRLDTLKSGLRRWSLVADSRRRQQPDATAASAGAGTDIIERLQTRSGIINNEALDEFIELFLADTTSRLDVLHKALEQTDLETIRRECHAMKGACLEMGVSGLSNCCDALGKASRDRRIDDLPRALQRLAAEFERVRPIFEAGRTRPH